MSGWEIFFNSAQLIAYGVGSGALAWASWRVWRIHRTNQDVQLRRIEKLTEKELEVLYWACHGGAYPHQDNAEAVARLLLYGLIEPYSGTPHKNCFTSTIYGFQLYFQRRSEEKEAEYKEYSRP